MATPGFKRGQLGSIRSETAYPTLRQYIATIRLTAKLLIGLISFLMIIGIVGSWVVWVVQVSNKQPADWFAAIAATVAIALTGTLLIIVIVIITRLLTELYELVVDAGDCLVDLAASMRHIDETGLSPRLAGTQTPSVPPSFIPSEAREAATADPAPIRAATAPVAAAAAEPPARDVRGTGADEVAASNLLQLAQRHGKNGNKQEALRCLRSIIDRYPRTEAADTARRFVDKSR